MENDQIIGLFGALVGLIAGVFLARQFWCGLDSPRRESEKQIQRGIASAKGGS